MAEPPESALPPSVLEKLRELNAELAEGESSQRLTWNELTGSITSVVEFY